jgi:hypothetical protein
MAGPDASMLARIESAFSGFTRAAGAEGGSGAASPVSGGLSALGRLQAMDQRDIQALLKDAGGTGGQEALAEKLRGYLTQTMGIGTAPGAAAPDGPGAKAQGAGKSDGGVA